MKKIIILIGIIFIGLLGYGLYKRDEISKQGRGIIQVDKQIISSEQCEGWFAEGKKEFRFGCDPLYDPA